MAADEWTLIEKLLKIADVDIGSATEATKRKTQNGVTYSLTVKPIEAMGAAAQLLNAINAGRKPTAEQTARARYIVGLAQWHKTGAAAEDAQGGRGRANRCGRRDRRP